MKFLQTVKALELFCSEVGMSFLRSNISKFVLLIMVIVLMVALVKKPSADGSTETIGTIEAKKNTSVGVSSTGSSTIKKSNDSIKAGSQPMLSPAEKAEVLAWKQSKGYGKGMFPTDVEYDAYSLDTLKSMIKMNNDVRAMLAFADKEFNRRAKGYVGARYMYELAAVHGSTRAINELAEDTFLERTKLGMPKSVEDQRALWVEVLSLYELAKLRGDREFYSSSLPSDLKIEKASLSPEDWQAARNQALTMYDDLQKRRLDLGLGEFDNSEPVSVKKWNDYLLSKSDIPELLK